MKSKKLLLSFSLVIVVALTLGVALPVLSLNGSAIVANAATSVAASSQDWTTQYNGNYYDGINANATGKSLRSQVAELITTTHKTYTTYDGLKEAFKTTDADPNQSGNIIWFYTGTSVKYNGTMIPTNREHVWPKDGGGAFSATSGPGADAHHLRPCDDGLNSTRGSKSFDEVPQTSSNIVKQNGSTSYGNLCYSSGSFFYPGVGYRGATARILFYMQTRWGDDNNLTFVDSAGKSKTIGKISTLMKWHLQEPPTDEEIRRNEVVFKLQGNRNPFIDHPEYATAIYCNDGQSYNNALKQVVAQYGDYNSNRPALEGLSLNVSSLTLTAGQTQTLSVTATPTGASAVVNWSSSNTNVATVVNGEVTAKANGTAIITATSTSNANIKATATVTVKGVTSLEIVGEPTKKIYEVGQKFDPTGLTVKLIYSDGSSETYSAAADLARFSWTDADTGKITLDESTTKIKCKYGSVEQTSSWTIQIKKATRLDLVGNPAKLTYDAGDVFDPTGLTVNVYYNDGTHVSYSTASELNGFTWVDSATGSDKLNKDTTTILCKKDDLSVISTWSVTIKQLTAIAIVGTPEHTTYQAGQSFDPTGLTVRLTYSDNSTRNLTPQEALQWCDWVDADTDSAILVQSTTKIKVKYQGLSYLGDFTVTVAEPPNTIGDFIDSVIAISSANTLKERFDAIRTALIEHAKLSEEDQDSAGAQASYQTLLNAIDSYNEDIAKHNDVMENATKSGAYTICVSLFAGVALVFVLRRLYF